MPPCPDQEREVRLYGKLAGTIRRLSLHELAFAYAPGYREDPETPPISTCLPKSMRAPSTRRATAWFTGLLPEGPRREQLARVVGTTHIDLWTLLDAAGAECAGAVQIVNPAYEDTPSLLRLEARELAALLHTTPVEPIGIVDRGAREPGVPSRATHCRCDRVPRHGRPATGATTASGPAAARRSSTPPSAPRTRRRPCAHKSAVPRSPGTAVPGRGDWRREEAGRGG